MRLLRKLHVYFYLCFLAMTFAGDGSLHGMKHLHLFWIIPSSRQLTNTPLTPLALAQKWLCAEGKSSTRIILELIFLLFSSIIEILRSPIPIAIGTNCLLFLKRFPIFRRSSRMWNYNCSTNNICNCKNFIKLISCYT